MPQDRASRPRSRRRAVAILLLGVGSLLTLAAFDAAAAGRHLRAARTGLLEARTALTRSDAAGAAAAFGRAAERFRAAEGALERPAVRLLGLLPLVGRSVDTTEGLSRSGAMLAGAGQELATRITALPGGLAALGPRDGRIPLETFGEIAPAVARAADGAGQALAIASRTPGSFLAGPVAAARYEVLRELRGIVPRLRGAALLLRNLPEAFGAGSPRRFFFAAQNPAELRGTGGILGAFSILTIDRGGFDFTPFRPIQTLRNLPVGRVTSPGPDYARNYDQFGGGGFWLNVNMTPDFPSAARAILESHEEVTGTRLDGVMTADPAALRSLLERTGPVEVPRLGLTVSAENVIPLTTNEAYSRFRDPATRKRVLGAVARQVFTRFLAGAEGSTAALSSILEPLTSGHLRVYSADARVQRGLELLGMDGGIAHQGDALTLIQNNAGGNKVDFYLDRRMDVHVRLGEGGIAHTSVAITLDNGAPASGPPPYVIGPYPKVSEAGENVSILNLFCARDCQLNRALSDGSEVRMITGTELGDRFYQRYLEIPSGRRSRLELELSTSSSWGGTENAGAYRLKIRGQHTIRPTTLRLAIQAPEGMRFVDGSPGVRYWGGTAVWSGALDPRLDVELAFERPWLNRTL